MALFKFISAKYADAFVDGSCIRIGTLEDFRKVEVHGSKIGDRHEGKAVSVSGTMFLDDSDNHPEYISRMSQLGAVISDVKNTLIFNHTFERAFRNCYAMSFSKAYDPSMWDAFPQGPDQYDIALRIEDENYFANILTNSIRDKLKSFGFASHEVECPPSAPLRQMAGN